MEMESLRLGQALFLKTGPRATSQILFHCNLVLADTTASKGTSSNLRQANLEAPPDREDCSLPSLPTRRPTLAAHARRGLIMRVMSCLHAHAHNELRAKGIPCVVLVEGLVFSSEFRVCCVFRALCESQSVTVNCPTNNFGPLRPLISKCFYHKERAAAEPPARSGGGCWC